MFPSRDATCTLCLLMFQHLAAYAWANVRVELLDQRSARFLARLGALYTNV